MKTATIILEKQRQKQIGKKVARILEQYDSFVLVEATEKQIEFLEQEGFKVVVPDDHGSIKLDAINNVESVLIADPKPGQYKITVLAAEVVEGPQEFALVYSGGLQ